MVYFFLSIPTGAIKRPTLRRICRCASLLSIPTGAIKSPLPKLLHAANPISIPTGAIKRYQNQVVPQIFCTFQFLLVRLKDDGGSSSSGGSSEFQFLLVRLKVGYELRNRLLIVFQFLLVRLKAELVERTEVLTFDFNSYWCD